MLLLLLLLPTASTMSGRNIHSTSDTAASNTATISSNSDSAAAAANQAIPPSAAAAAAAVDYSADILHTPQGYPDSHGLLSHQLADLLNAIQDAHVYDDSKTAVDLVLKSHLQDVAASFSQWRAANNQTDPTALRQFITANLEQAGSDLIECNAPDWQPTPTNFLPRLAAAAAAAGGDSASYSTGMNATAQELYDFGLKVHALWGLLCREVCPDVAAHPERHSLLPLPNRTVVPGDRFREVYYWDSYWVIRGLLVSQMTHTALGMVNNLLSMLRKIGHVPNGARVYYLNRSQPPILSAMVRQVYEALCTNSSSSSSDLLHRALPLLLMEHQNWTTNNKQVKVMADDGTVYNLSRYWADFDQPRPESYREDVMLAYNTHHNTTGASDTHTLPSDSVTDYEAVLRAARGTAAAAAAVDRLFHEIASGAESGWDFSSRWFADNKLLATIRTTQIIPADLNAWLYQMERNIAWMADITGNEDIEEQFNGIAAARKEAIEALLWDEAAATWRDGTLTPVNTTTNTTTTISSSGTHHSFDSDQMFTVQQNTLVFASNFVPLWTGLTEGDDERGQRVVEALKNSGLVGPAGIATSLYETGQQWDYPNGWPPLQHMLIEGARRYGGKVGEQFAASMARTWVGVNLNVYNATGAMHEKYNVSVAGGLVGGGGEYKPQVGFGWSNGVLLDLLNTYF